MAQQAALRTNSERIRNDLLACRFWQLLKMQRFANRHTTRVSPTQGRARPTETSCVCCPPRCRRYVDYPITDVLQMMGRAGRPQYDRHGVAVIMVRVPRGVLQTMGSRCCTLSLHLPAKRATHQLSDTVLLPLRQGPPPIVSH